MFSVPLSHLPAVEASTSLCSLSRASSQSARPVSFSSSCLRGCFGCIALKSLSCLDTRLIRVKLYVCLVSTQLPTIISANHHIKIASGSHIAPHWASAGTSDTMDDQLHPSNFSFRPVCCPGLRRRTGHVSSLIPRTHSIRPPIHSA
jgi:hypothetical protein